MRTFSGICVHQGDEYYQVNSSKFLAVMTMRLDDVCIMYVLRSAAHKAAC